MILDSCTEVDSSMEPVPLRLRAAANERDRVASLGDVGGYQVTRFYPVLQV